MKKKKFLSAAFILLLHSGIMAQQNSSWSLQNCIDYALENNIQLQKEKVFLEESEVDVKTAQAALFPGLSFSTNQNVTNRPYSESRTNIVDDGSGNLTANSTDSKTNYNGSYGLNASWTVWNGGKRINQIKQQKLNTEIAGLNFIQQALTLEETITQVYIQILYTAESVKVNENSLEVAIAQRDRAKEMLEVGSIAKSDLAQLEAQVADAHYQLVNAQATLSEYKLQLKQILELDGNEELSLTITEPEDQQAIIPLPDKMDVYETALSFRPEIQSSKLSIQAIDFDIKMAKAGYSPTINLIAGTGTSNTSGSDFSLGTQWKNNWNNSIGLSLSMPIFNNRQTKSSIQKAKLQRETSSLNLQDEQKNLFSTIENIWLGAQTSQLRFIAAQSKVSSCEISYDLVQQQFNLGLKNTIELLTEKNNLLSAQQEKLQAKYTAILNIQLLKFYQGESMAL